MVHLKKALVSLAVLVLFLCVFSGVVNAESSGTDKQGTVTCDVLRMRSTPSTSAKVVTKLSKGAQVDILSGSDGWYKVSYKGTKGWVSGDYIKIKTITIGTGKVTTEILNLRNEPNTSAKVITKLKAGDKVNVLSRSGKWYKVKTTSGKSGWAHSDYVSISTTSRSAADRTRNGTTKATEQKVITQDKDAAESDKLIGYAKELLDVAYVYGGESPKEGFDCSGFTKYVFKHSGITLERVASDQAGQGKKVAKSALKPGDLVFFSTHSDGIDHVGIYIGNGKFIHAESPKHGVNISELSESYYERSYVTARRIL